MNGLDLFFLLLLLISLLLGMWRGLVYELLSLAAWVAAFFVAQWGAEVVGSWLPLHDSVPSLRYALGFALLFIVSLFVGGLLASLARRAARALGIRPVDRSLGVVFGLARGLLVLVLVALLVGFTPAHQSVWWRESVVAGWLDQTVQRLRAWLPSLATGSSV